MDSHVYYSISKHLALDHNRAKKERGRTIAAARSGTSDAHPAIYAGCEL